VVGAVERVKAFFEEQGIVPPFRIAIMGCEVNGPGEAREAEVGLAFSRSGAVIFSKGRVEKVVSDREVLEYFIAFLAEKIKSVEAKKGGSCFEDVSSVCPNFERNTSGS
jgi:(E)-4-hydroxy-3-methylbut-2-enyl-diphosphate synthase